MTVNTDPSKMRAYSSDVAGWDEEESAWGVARIRLTKILTRDCDMVINMPILKDHEGAGVTFAMKNMYGVVDKPYTLHANHCNPAVADLNCIPAIRKKVRFTIGDAMSSVYDGGPGFHPERLWYPNALLIGEDRVALDTIAWEMIERKRGEIGLATLRSRWTAPALHCCCRRSIARPGNERSKAHSESRNLSERCDEFRSRPRSTSATPMPNDAPITRREAMLQLLRVGGMAAGAAGLVVWLSERSTRPVPAKPEQARRDHRVATNAQFPQMTVVQNGEPAELVRQALENLGGIGRFVSRQDVVVLKPNIAWDRTPEQAANTNPDLVAEVVRQCWQAGAKRVIVTDVSCNDPRRCFMRSGIQQAARAQGAEVILPIHRSSARSTSVVWC